MGLFSFLLIDSGFIGSVMRFPQLTIGQQFEYQGKRYTKTGPMTATEESTGASTMIRRSAEVIVVVDVQVEPSTKQVKKSYNRRELLELCQEYKTKLHSQLRQMATDEGGLQLDPVLNVIDTTLDIS
ncbi:MAG: hypothetical protein KUF79_06650 [Candidatus Thiodiazotropha sp. (ex Ctena orbiculata)]|nr:hypothetical protein [Candidatus Thiodiazotropha taylori]